MPSLGHASSKEPTLDDDTSLYINIDTRLKEVRDCITVIAAEGPAHTDVLGGVSQTLRDVSDKLDSLIQKARIAKFRLDPDALLNEEEAATLIGFTRRALQAWRVRGGGPPFLRISSRALRYLRSDLLSWAESKRKVSTSEV